jgi:nicotinate phosphoribosyltransferase
MDGLTTDVYFSRTMEILKAKGMMGEQALSEFTVSSLPNAWPWAVLCGAEETINLLEGKNCDLWGLPEGTVFRARDIRGNRVPVLTINGSYSDYCVYETPCLGFMCHESGIATMAARCKWAAGDRRVIAFGIRRMNPFLAPALDRASFIGGCDGVSSLVGAETIGEKPSGTMPHALMVMFGNEKNAYVAFDEIVDKDVPRVALIDTYTDEKVNAIIACESIKDLNAVRLDTPGSRRGSFPELIREVRWEMDIRGYGHVDIIASGGLDERKILSLSDVPVDGFGVGTSISNAPTVDFAMDIVERKGVPVAKRGKLGGRKSAFRCPECLEFSILPFGTEEIPVCDPCGTEMEAAEKMLLKSGERVSEPLSPRELRDYVLKQLAKVEL